VLVVRSQASVCIRRFLLRFRGQPARLLKISSAVFRQRASVLNLELSILLSACCLSLIFPALDAAGNGGGLTYQSCDFPIVLNAAGNEAASRIKVVIFPLC
jgi:hypothetical protein